MKYRMCGDIVQLLRYKVTQKNSDPAINEYCVYAEERDAIVQRFGGAKNCVVKEIDQTGNEWLDGMEFRDASQVPEALEMGEAAWRARVNANDGELQMMMYLADLDYRLILLELGVTL
jgi:hypothetical protein